MSCAQFYCDDDIVLLVGKSTSKRGGVLRACPRGRARERMRAFPVPCAPHGMLYYDNMGVIRTHDGSLVVGLSMQKRRNTVYRDD